MNEDQDEELRSDDDEELDSMDEDDDDDGNDDDDEDAELDDISETELQEMAASTQRSLFMVQMQIARQRAAEEEAETMDIDVRSPSDRWQEFLNTIPRSKVFKITDSDCQEMDLETFHHQHNQVLDELMTSIRTHPGLTHVILEGRFLQILQKNQQRNFFESFWTRHCATLTYIRLGSDQCSPHFLDVDSLFMVLRTVPELRQQELQSNMGILLTELELRKISFDKTDQIISLEQVLNHATRLKQLNLLGIHVEDAIARGPWLTSSTSSTVVSLFDPILNAAAELVHLDECRLVCLEASLVPLISPTCLSRVLARKPKWWRLALDGVGLEDQHCQVIAQAMSDEDCKAGDLLSLTLNPAVSSLGWSQMFVDVLFQKQRMGLVKVDDAYWQATFDLVRSMNNIHGRLSFLDEAGSYTSRERWIEWLAKLSQISWEDEAHKVNYLWFTILERPDFVHHC